MARAARSSAFPKRAAPKSWISAAAWCFRASSTRTRTSIFPASRAAEYEQRIAGATYEQIAQKGGGIRSTVHALRRASPKLLKERALQFLREFAAHGTTTLEAKSGYGLDWKNELKILNVLTDLQQEQPLDILRTFLGAHVVPPEFRKRPNAWIDLLVSRLIPAVAHAGLAEFCDVFCDAGAFTVEQARKVLGGRQRIAAWFPAYTPSSLPTPAPRAWR